MRLAVILLLLPFYVLSQVPSADFEIQANACLNSRMKIENTSGNAQRYEWDFCEGDLALSPSGGAFRNLSLDGANVPVGVDFIMDAGRWYGFYCSILTNSIFRLDFGPDLTNPNPVVVSLGNPGNLLNGPQDIRVVKQGGNYYGFVSNRTGYKLIRIEFGSSLTAFTSEFTSTGILVGNAIGNGGVEIAFDGQDWIVALTNEYNISVLNFGSSLSYSPQASDLLETNNIVGASTLGDIIFLKSGGAWFGYTVSVNNGRLYELSFGPTLFANPTVNQISLTALSGYSPAGIWGWEENNSFGCSSVRIKVTFLELVWVLI